MDNNILNVPYNMISIINMENKLQTYFGEMFVPLRWNNFILNRYAISNFGRLYDLQRNSLVNYSIDKDGYYMASITVEGVGYKKIRVHRFELLSFKYIPNFMDYICNHKDGNKHNLYIDNLEWVTSLYNTRSGWDMGLNPNIGINNGNGKYTEDQIRKICELISKGFSNAKICNEFNITNKNDRMRFSAIISSIRHGKSHVYISKEYGISIGNLRYSLEFAYLVFNFLTDKNRIYTYKEIMDALNIPNEHRKQFKVYIDDLVRGRTAKEVKDFYDDEGYIINKPIYKRDDDEYLFS